MKRFCILIIDDDEAAHEVLGEYLELAGFRVLHARDGAEGIQTMEELGPDLALLDVNMPVMDGFKAMEVIGKDRKLRDIPVLFLTSLDRYNLKIKGLELGAEDYIVKPISIGKILARIRAALRRSENHAGTTVRHDEIIRIEDLEINVPNYSVRVGTKELAFPRKEFETLAYLARNRGRVISREALLNAVWGENVYVVDRTIDVHIRKIREKLGSFADRIETVKGVGYRFKGDS